MRSVARMAGKLTGFFSTVANRRKRRIDLSFKKCWSTAKPNRGRVGFVVVNDLSRSSRQMEDQVAVIADLEAVGAP
jgi:hypothetical protein